MVVINTILYYYAYNIANNVGYCWLFNMVVINPLVINHWFTVHGWLL
jgi:hypothetical protein